MQTSQTQQSAPRSAIAEAAYYQWLQAGKPSGRDQEFWFTAEKRVQQAGQGANASRGGSQGKNLRANRA